MKAKNIKTERLKKVLHNDKINRKKLSDLIGHNRAWLSDFTRGKRKISDEDELMLIVEINRLKNASKMALRAVEMYNSEALKYYFTANPINILSIMGGNRKVQSAIISYKNGKTKDFPYRFEGEIKQGLLSFALELSEL